MKQTTNQPINQTNPNLPKAVNSLHGFTWCKLDIENDGDQACCCVTVMSQDVHLQGILHVILTLFIVEGKLKGKLLRCGHCWETKMKIHQHSLSLEIDHEHKMH